MSDYYKILEINKYASDEEIKKAYKKLALKYHPDKNSGSTEKFQEISKAYETLSDKEKRKIYDFSGTDTFINSNDIFFTASYIFEEFDEIINLSKNLKGEDETYNLHVNLEDIYLMNNKSLKLNKIRKIGSIYQEKEIEFQIATYLKQIIIKEQGNDIKGYLKRGDLVFNIIPKPHKKFRIINDYDLLMEYEVGYRDLIYDFIIKIEHIDHEILYIKCLSFIDKKYFYCKIKEKGLYNGEKRADLYIYFTINLSKEYILEKIESEKYIESIQTNPFY